MRSSVLIASAGLALAAGSALADVIDYTEMGTPTLASSFRLGTPGGFRFTAPTSSPDPGTSIYDIDDVNVGVGSFANGGTAVQAGNSITRMVVDDCQTISYSYGSVITRMYFSVTNANTVSVSARPRLRFWYEAGNGLGTNPGNPFPVSGASGFSFNPISFGASSSNVFFFDLGASALPLNGTSMTLWCGITFDNNAGSTGTTTAQMNLLGQATCSPSPQVGSSTTAIFRTNAAGSFLGASFVPWAAGPGGSPGTILNLASGTNLAWGIIAAAPAPSAVAIFGLGGIVAARRRRA